MYDPAVLCSSAVIRHIFIIVFVHFLTHFLCINEAGGGGGGLERMYECVYKCVCVCVEGGGECQCVREGGEIETADGVLACKPEMKHMHTQCRTD